MTTSSKSSENAVFVVLLLFGVLLFVFADSPFGEKLNKISTGLVVILTAGYVLFTAWILKSNRKSIEEQTRPFVVASLPLQGFEILLSVKNIGNRPAKNVQVAFVPSLDSIHADPPFAKTAQPLLAQIFMPPGFEVSNPIALTTDILSTTARVFHVTVKYTDSRGEEYSEAYDIDLNSYVYREREAHQNVEHYLHSISESIKKLASMAK